MKRLLVPFLLAVAACNPNTDALRLSAPLAAPIPADYKKQVLAWAKRYYAEPSSIRSARISDPVPVRLVSGWEVWLVCIEADPRGRGAGQMGPQRVALGIAPGLLVAPLERIGQQLTNAECEREPLVWRPFPQLQQRS